MNGKKKLIVLLAAIVIAVAAVVGVVLSVVSCKDHDNSESVDNGIAKNAEYYCVAEDEEYVVTLTNGKTYFLSIAGENITGDYTLSESGELKLVVDGKEVSASISGDELAITYGGKSYTLLEKIKRSVTFDNDGATTTVAVLNGKAIAKPADPEEKDGKKFVGWFTSAEYKEVYNFAMPVRADITVYAQHVKLTAGAHEFTATLKDGSDEKIQTANGVVYGLESLADKDGKEFDGWYVSDFNDEAKLTYKYNGEVLQQNVNLYPVWKGEVNAISVTEGKISWESDGTSFDIKITDANNVSETKRATQKYLDYDFKNIGEYKIEIGKTGSDKVTVVYYNSKALARVSNITIVEGGVVSYNAVENAEKYIVTVDCGNKSHKHTGVDNGKRTYFDISGCDMQDGGIKIVVVAQAKGWGSSQSEAFYYERLLDKIDAVDIKDGKLVWSEVKNALGYVVTVNGEKIELGNVNEFSLKGYAAGEYELGVYPVTKGYNSPEAATITYKKDKLATPAGVAVNGNVLKWDSVEGATSYSVNLNGKTFTTDKNEAELNAEDIKTDNTVTVTAIGDGVQSEESDVFAFAQGKMSELAYVDGKVEWKGIYGAQAYVIKLNGNLLATVEGDVTSYKVDYKIAGENKITVGYATEQDATEAIDEASVVVTVYTVSFISDDGENLGSALVAEGDPIDAPAVEKAGFVFAGWYKVPNGGKNNAQKYTGGKLEKAGDVRFYADFDTAKYKVTLNADADPENQIEDTVAFKQYFTLQTIEPEDESKAFGGWYTEPGGQGKQITDNMGNGIGKWTYAYDGVKLYAYWVNLFNFEYNNQGFIVTGAEGLQYVTSAKIPATHFDGQHNAKVITIDELEYGDKLVSIDIPDTVTTIQTGAKLGTESSAFKACKSLKSINIYKTGEPVTAGYVSFDGILYEAVYVRDSEGNEQLSSLNLLLVPYAKDGDIVVADGTSSIATYAFSSTAAVTVTIPESVVEVKDYAFSSMPDLVEVKFLGSDAKKQVTLGENVFASDSKLTKITLPAGLKASTHHVKEWNNGREDPNEGSTKGTYVIYEYDIDFDTFLFDKTTKLQTIEINGNGGYYKSVDGMLCKADGTIVYCPQGREKAVVTTNEITAIGNGAFKNCTKLESVTINAGVTYIGKEAFYCTYSASGNFASSLNELVFNTDVNDEGIEIDERAFYQQNLISVTLPENLVKLSKFAFGNNKNLKTVTILSAGENGTLNFADDAFASMPDTRYNYVSDYVVENVIIGKNVPAFGISAVFGSLLKDVAIDKDNSNFDTSDEKVYYSKDGKQVVYANVANLRGDLVLKDGVEIINANVFENASQLTSVTIPSSVKVIGDGAFRKSGLTSLVFSDEKEGAAASLDIGKQAFYGCKVSGVVTLPERLTSIGYGAFTRFGASEIKFTGTKLTTIGQRAFDSSSITSMTLGNGVTTIGAEAFYNCRSLEDLNLPESITELGSNFLDGCDKLQTVNVAEGCKGLKTIQGVLYRCENDVPVELVLCVVANEGDNGTLTIPNTVTMVGDGAFTNNKGIKKLIFEDYTDEYIAAGNTLSIGSGTAYQYVFDGSNIEYVKLPRGMVVIKAYSFTSFKTLKEVVIPNTVRKIEQYSFSSDASLETITFEAGNDEVSLEIEDGTSQYNGAFASTTNLKEVILPARTTKIGAWAFGQSQSFTKDLLTKIFIPAGVKEIGEKAFACRPNLSSLTFEDTEENPSQLTKIGDWAFTNRKNVLSGSINKLTEIKLPASIEEIGEYAFSYCGIKSLIIPASVKIVGDYAFDSCKNLITLNFENPESDLSIGNYAFNSCSKLTTVELPDGLTAIGNWAFAATGIDEITLPSTLQTIGDWAFSSSSLGSVNFDLNEEDKCALKSIGYMAFGSTKLTEFTFPETTDDTLTLGSNLFQSCMSLTKVVISSSVKSLGNALDGATEISEIILPLDGGIKAENGFLTNGKDTIYSVYGDLVLDNGTLVIPEGITTLGDKVFMGYTNIKTVVLPSTISSIGIRAFANCTSLEKVVFTKGAPSLFEISGRAFENCVSLKSIDLPTNLETISYYAFANSGLESVKIPATVATLGGKATELVGITLRESEYGNSFDSCKSLKSVTFAQNGDLKILTKETFLNCTALESVTLPDGLEEIQDRAFKNTKLTSISIGAVVTSIGVDAFENTSSLTTVKFAENGSLNTIGNYAFEYSGLTSVEIPSTVTSLGRQAFIGCAKLETVTFKGGLISTIQDSTFKGTAIKSITLPESVKIIEKCAFMDCSELTTVNLPSGLTTLGSENSGGSSNTAEKFGVFANCTLLTDIMLPESLTYIGAFAFAKSGLQSITIPAGVQYLTAKNSMLSQQSNDLKNGKSEGYFAGQFAYCYDLEEVILPITINSIGAGVFYNTPKLKTLKYDGYTETDNILHQNVQYLGGYAFVNSGLENLTAKGLQEIYSNGFNAAGFASIDLESTSVQTINDSMFANLSRLTSVKLPSGLKTIGASAFEGSGITNIIVPETLTTIGKAAFKNSAIREISLVKVTNIGASAFEGCKSLTKAVLGNSIEELPDSLFKGCSSLKEFTIPEKVSIIGDDCLLGTAIENLTIPAKLTNLGVGALGSSAIKSVSVDSGNKTFKVEDNFLKNTAGKLIAYLGSESEVTLPVSDAGVADGVFAGNTSIKKITLPETVKTVTSNMFYGCLGVETIVLDGVTTIDANAFDGCVNLKNIMIPSSVTSIAASAFTGAGAMDGTSELTVDLTDAAAEIFKVSSMFKASGVAKVILPDDITTLADEFFYDANYLKEVKLPDGLTEIPESLFDRCASLTKMDIPASVTQIGERSFNLCENLITVNFLGNDKITEIPERAFWGCYSLKNINLPESLETIGEDAFTGYKQRVLDTSTEIKGAALESIVIPKNVTKIDTYAFQYCDQLKTVEVKGELKQIGNYAFSNCVALNSINVSTVTKFGNSVFANTAIEHLSINGNATLGKNMFSGMTSLKTVTFTEGSTTLPSSLFSGCTALTSVTLPDKITAIPASLFASCANLTEVNIPDTVTSIGGSAFSGCSSLTSVNVGDNVKSIDYAAFKDCTSIKSIYIPATVESIGASGIFLGWKPAQTINFGYEGYQAFRLYGEKLLSGCAAKVNFGVAK